MLISRFKYVYLSSTIIIYKALLDLIYYFVISKYFDYAGFTMSVDVYLYSFSWVLTVLFIPLIISNTLNEKFASNLVLSFLWFISFIPFVVMVGFKSFDYQFILSNLAFFLVIYFLHKYSLKIKRYNYILKEKKANDFILWSVGLFFLILVVFISARYTGFRLSFDLINVYDLREESKQFNLPLIVSYLFAASKAINPIILMYALYKKNYLFSFLIIIIQMLSFGVNGSKSVFFITFLSILIFMFAKKNFLIWLPSFFSLVALIGILEYFILNTFNIINFVIRRVMFLPNLLNEYYFDFFSGNVPDYFRQSFLRNFGLESEYEKIPNMIGYSYFNRPDMVANNGLISDAITNMGIIGIVISPLFIVTFLWLYDNATHNLDRKIYIMSSIYIAYTLIGSFMLPALLTHGFIAMVIILFLLPRDKTAVSMKEGNIE